MKFVRTVVLAALLLLLSGCTITVTPVATKRKKSQVRHTKHKTSQEKKKPITVGVVKEAWWVENYKKLESAHGDYTIPDDSNIRPLPNGSFLVPREVLQHNQDLLLAPKAVPTP